MLFWILKRSLVIPKKRLLDKKSDDSKQPREKLVDDVSFPEKWRDRPALPEWKEADSPN